MASAIVEGLLRIARAIGRWILEHAARYGGLALMHYMQGRVDVFKRRRAKATTDRRREWLTGRISRWNAGIRWLKSKLDALAGCAGEAFAAIAKAHPEIPHCSPLELAPR